MGLCLAHHNLTLTLCHLPQVVITADHFCITRPDSLDVIERLDLLTLQGIGLFHPGDDAQERERRGSMQSVESVLKRSTSIPAIKRKNSVSSESSKRCSQSSDKPAMQFKVVDEHDNKRRYESCP